MNPTHTPGPWMVSEGDTSYYPLRVSNFENKEICSFHDFNVTKAANARLIASAPELLEALEGLLANAPQPSKKIKESFHYLVYREAACKAIAKAKGV